MKFVSYILVAYVAATAASWRVEKVMNGRLPNCQEDEYLYPENYSGPGKNEVSDYICVHIDEINPL